MAVIQQNKAARSKLVLHRAIFRAVVDVRVGLALPVTGRDGRIKACGIEGEPVAGGAEVNDFEAGQGGGWWFHPGREMAD